MRAIAKPASQVSLYRFIPERTLNTANLSQALKGFIMEGLEAFLVALLKGVWRRPETRNPVPYIRFIFLHLDYAYASPQGSKGPNN